MDGLTSNVYNTGTAHHNDPDSFQYYLIRNDDIGAINVLHYAEKSNFYGNHDGLLRRRMMEYNIYFNNDYTYYEDTQIDELKRDVGF